MFHSVSPAIQEHMRRLEGIDAKIELMALLDCTGFARSRSKFAGFLAITAINSSPGHLIEISAAAVIQPCGCRSPVD